jgi:hypothetical protein
MFDNVESKWVTDLSKEVSALANTEGGEIILGIKEDTKAKPKVASEIDGVSTTHAPERLQQLIEGNLSPYLPGIRVHRVRLSARIDRVVFVVQVPQGSTAYQANDGRYYGRSEFEAKHLPDHEVRLRMMRGRLAQGQVKLVNIRKEEELSATGRITYHCSFHLVVENDGEINISELKVAARGHPPFRGALHYGFDPSRQLFEDGIGHSSPIPMVDPIV